MSSASYISGCMNSVSEKNKCSEVSVKGDQAVPLMKHWTLDVHGQGQLV
jgi:hypothetical protein